MFKVKLFSIKNVNAASIGIFPTMGQAKEWADACLKDAGDVAPNICVKRDIAHIYNQSTGELLAARSSRTSWADAYVQ